MAGKKVLEIGLGEGAESERWIRQGARWSGVDLTAEAVERIQTRLILRELPYEEPRRGSVLDLPFADDSFDMVFSTWCSAMASCIMCPRTSRRKARSTGYCAQAASWSS